MNSTAGAHAAPDFLGSTLWIALVIALAMFGSFAYACAAPLAAIAALAALTLGRTEGLILVVATWLINQFVGHVLLSYPHTFSSHAWGLAIGAGTIVGFLAARAVTRRDLSRWLVVPLVFLTAFVFYQVGMFASASSFTSAERAFSTAIVQEVFLINVVGFAGFLLVHRLAVALALVKPVAGRAGPATA